MSEVVFCVHHNHDDVDALVATATEWLQTNGHRGFVVADDVDELDGAVEAMLPATAALVVTLGGDGTMLRAVRHLDGANVPLLGVNLGQLGYLTEVEPTDLLSALESFFAGPEAGGWHLDERMMLAVTAAAEGTGPVTWRALNDAVVERSDPGHTIRLQATIDGATFTSYTADGLIVSTPTGSTAYSLSARGPVVSPQHRALLLTPVAPHMLFDRSLVLDPSELIEIEVIGHRHAELSVDGVGVCTLKPGSTVEFRPAEATASFVRFGPYRYHQILKAKFGLTDR